MFAYDKKVLILISRIFSKLFVVSSINILEMILRLNTAD